MICKDCIHYQMCGSVNIDAPCAAFKNKADFVKIVRCKNCRYKKVGYGQFGAYYYCSHITSGLRDIEETDFCNYGEEAKQ